jgi:DNA-binding CsgD family transcriptional regulator
MPNGLVLEFLSNPCIQFFLLEQEGMLGRSPRCRFRVNDPTISRQHASLQRTDSGFAVTDLDSRNGTNLDEVRIMQATLHSGQRIRFGRLTFTARLEDLNDMEPETTDGEASWAKERSSGVPTSTVLSSGQRRVFACLLTGQSEKAIARQLEISQFTVHNHTQAIFRLLGVHSKAELVAKFLVSESLKAMR